MRLEAELGADLAAIVVPQALIASPPQLSIFDMTAVAGSYR